ncbi:MAG: hypothetical protein ABN482_10440 [Corticimicrobacter sp.]|uniref:hypothetical protein n=1 Tax=Corticimicrobacter sp. TaxID=2678536 RepID=UPI0032DAC8F5
MPVTSPALLGQPFLVAHTGFPNPYAVAFAQPRDPIALWRSVLRPKSLSLVGRRVASRIWGLLPDPNVQLS